MRHEDLLSTNFAIRAVVDGRPVLGDGACRFSGFIGVVEGFDRGAAGTPILRLKSFVNAEAGYELRVAAAELKQSTPALRTGDKVIFGGRFENATVRSSTLDFPIIRDYIVRVRRQP